MLNENLSDYELELDLLELDGTGPTLAEQALRCDDYDTLLKLEENRRRKSNEMGAVRYVESCKVENPEFKVGSKVRIVTRFADFQFFRLGETGTVIKNSGDYFGISVLLDSPHLFKDGDDMLISWGFNYDHLVLLEEKELSEKIIELLNNGQFESPYWKERDQDKICW